MAHTTHSSDFQGAARPRGCDASRMSCRRRVLALVSLAAVAAGAWSQPVLAQQTYTWANDTGGGSVWGNSASWVGAPSPLTFNTQTDIIFNSADVVSRNNAVSIGGTKIIRSLTINADYVTSNNNTFDIRTYTTFGGPANANLRFEAASGNASITVAESTSGTVQVRLGSSDGGNVVIFSNLDLDQDNTHFNATGFQFESPVSGAGAINKTGAGLVRMVRNNGSWSGGMNINEGEVSVFANGDAMGTGVWTLGGDANNTTFSAGSTASQNNTGGLLVAAGAGTRTIALMSTTGGNPTLAGTITLGKDTLFDVGNYVAGTHDRLTVSNAIGGTGGIVKTNSGILVLNGTGNNYSGTTDIQSGKFFLGGAGRLGSGDVTIASGANLDFGTGTGQTNIVANNISGGGEIIQSTASTDTRFTGNVTSTGGMQILNGTVQIGNSGTTGSYSGDAVVSAGAALAFNRSTNYAHGGTISGDGGVSKVSTGTVTLSGNNTYEGLTQIFNGTLIADSVSALGAGFIRFNALGGGTPILEYTANSASTDWATRFGGSDAPIRLDTGGSNVELAGIIDDTNTSGLIKRGSGVLTLGGANTYTGATSAVIGGLIINGSQASTDLTTVSSGAWIGGTGSLTGGLTINAGGLFVFDPLAPTLNVTGTVLLDSTFSVASLVDPDGSAISWSSVSDSTYSLIGLTSSTFGSIANFGADAAAPIGDGRTAYFTNTTESGGLSLVVVPEPSTVALLGSLAAVGGLLARRRLTRS